MCDSKSIGDEFHFILECTHFVNDRKMFLSKIYHENPNVIKLSELVNTFNVENIKKNLSWFVKKMFFQKSTSTTYCIV